MLDKVPELPAVELGAEDYLADYYRELNHTQGLCFKLERRQTFREPGDPSWEALAAGDWARAMELNERDRPTATAMVRRDRASGIQRHRIRVVEVPVTAYLQWEMHFLRFLAEEGQDLRVLHAEQVKAWEAQRPLPEIVTLGRRALYEVHYDDTGTHSGGRRISDAEVIAACQADLAHLFDEGEPLLDFFHREIAPLPPPG